MNDDRELARRCLGGDQQACTVLVETYASMVGTVIWRATGDHGIVEDLAQEAFFRVFRGLRYFDGRAKLSTWIYTIAHRVAIDHLRQVRVSVEANGVSDAALRPRRGETIDANSPEAAAAREEMETIVRSELGALPDKYRLPLVYAAIEELDYETIAGMLKVKPAAVKTLVFRARQMLRARVDAVLAARREPSHAT